MSMNRSLERVSHPRGIWLLREAGPVAIIVVASLAALKPPVRDYLFYLYAAPWSEFVAVLPSTAWAAVKVWTFWTLAAVILGGILLRIEPQLGVLDAAVGGFTGVWIFAYVAGNALGPIGLFRSWMIWALLAVGALWLWRTPPRLEPQSLSTGHKLMLLAFALIAPVLVLLQLGSPVPPFMDVLATPAAAQRVITFGLYLPFDSDPLGYWQTSAQLPGLELFYALLGLGSGTSLALLADTAAITPMAGLLILTTYRLGKTIAGDLIGGMASLLLFATILFRTLPYMHGRTVSFVLVGAGLAFFLDGRRNKTRVTLGALALSTAVASHAVNGALAMMVAAASVVLWLLNGELVAALAGTGILAGASLVALPAVAVGLGVVLPYPVLPLTQLVGVAVIGICARRLHDKPLRDRARWLRCALALLAAVVLLWHPSPLMPNNHHTRFPFLVFGGGLGFALLLMMDGIGSLRRIPPEPKRPLPVLFGPVAAALVLAIGIEYASATWYTKFQDPRLETAVHEWFYKIDYWYPYLLTFPAAYLAAWLYATLSRRGAVLLMLAMLFVPWRDYVDSSCPSIADHESRLLRALHRCRESITDPNYHQHSIPEGWIYQSITGKGGYWGSTGDSRWAQTPAEMDLIEVLRGEIAAGRITPATHVVHLEPGEVHLYTDVLRYSVYTGIDDDIYIGNRLWDPASEGTRKHRFEQAHARLAEHPPYVAIHGNPELAPEALQGYTEIFNRDGVRLLRYDGASQ
jgi:hypothetical protein